VARARSQSVCSPRSELERQYLREFSNQEVHHRRFQDIAWIEEFDGIWASASLLHVPGAELPEAFRRLARALKPGGVWSLSFKYGTGERFESGRHFTYCNEERLAGLLGQVPCLRLERCWRSRDSRPNRQDEFWLNAILVRGVSAI
jgi:SAM-dependent methyltransferase